MDAPYTPTHEVAYCMGLIVGEGSFSADGTQPQLVVRLHQSDPQPLLDLKGLLGGTLNGPYFYNGRHSRVWMLRGWELLEALPYFDRWLPKSRKREQYDAWRLRWAAYFDRLPYVSRFSTPQRTGWTD